MPVDSGFEALLADPRNHVRPPPAHIPIEKVRKAANAAMLGNRRTKIHATADFSLPAPGRFLRARLYRPSPAPGLPAALFCHGGGWIWGDLETHDAICRDIAVYSEAAVLSLEYRLAPETPYPGALEDVTAALNWLAASAPALGLDGGRLAICGDSAGGNLAFAAALLARDNANLPRINFVGLLYPVVDPGCDSGSQTEFSSDYLLTGEAMRYFWGQYLNGRSGAADPLFAPLNADLSGLPPTTIATAEFDILRDEGEQLADRLAAAGVPVQKRRYPGMIHGFASFPDLTPMASVCLAELSLDLRKAFNGPKREMTT